MHPTRTSRPRATRAALFAVAAVAAVAACGPPGPVVLEVGTGGSEFEPVAPGGQVEIVCGPQGGQHVWMSLRARHLDGDRASILLQLVHPDRDEPECGQVRSDVVLASRDGWHEYAGSLCFIVKPAALDGKRLTLQARITDAAGRVAEASVEVVVVDASAGCRRGG